MNRDMRKRRSFGFIVFLVVCFFLIPLREVLAAEEFWKLPPVPTIEELTHGKVKVGDAITKENVDLVKDLLPVSTYELVKQGLILDIGKVSTPGGLIPEFFRKATEESYKAVGRPSVDGRGVVYTKEGKPWPGGRPFPNPQNVLEIMANAKYGESLDDDDIDVKMALVDKEGKIYKTDDLFIQQVWCTTREFLPPLGAIPGYENQYKTMVMCFTAPRDVKGLGQYYVRHWDDVKDPDEGFMYLPAFKRTIRVSMTTWQDSMGGGDYTWGDTEGLYEPYSYWKFKLIGTKPMLSSAPTEKSIRIPGTRDLDLSQFTEGVRFHRDTWEVDNFYVVEATPAIKHIYSKKILYVEPDTTFVGVAAFDNYDTQGQLWRGMVISRHVIYPKGHPDQRFKGMDMMNYYDLQTRNQTVNFGTHRPDVGIERSTLTMRKLIEVGR